MSDALGYQFFRDPNGDRWRVDGFTPIVARLTRVHDGYQISFGKSILRGMIARGELVDDGFEPARGAVA